MRLKKILLIFIIVVFTRPLTCAAQATLDTISYSMTQKPEPFAKIGTRSSFINNYRAKILGVKLGLDFNNRVRLGLGYNQLYSSAASFDKKIYFTNELHQLDSLTTKLKLWYFSVLGEYVYHQNNNWKFSIPIQLGAGEVYYKYDVMNQTIKSSNNFIVVYEPAVSVEYKIIKWVGVGADIGFRFIVTNYKQLNQKLNSPTYSFKLLIYYGEIYRDIKHRWEL